MSKAMSIAAIIVLNVCNLIANGVIIAILVLLARGLQAEGTRLGEAIEQLLRIGAVLSPRT